MNRLTLAAFHLAGTCRWFGVSCPLCMAEVERKARRIVQDAVTAVYADERTNSEWVDIGGEA